MLSLGGNGEICTVGVQIQLMDVTVDAKSEEKYDLEVTVEDLGNDHIESVEVELDAVGTYTENTDANGYVKFEDVSVGEHELILSKPGYYLLSEDVSISSDKSITLQLEDIGVFWNLKNIRR